MIDARAVAEQTARASYGRLLAALASRARNITVAEDALGDAFAAALRHWPTRGVPDSPEAWLLTAARRKLIDDARRVKTRTDAVPSLLIAMEEAQSRVDRDEFPDERLKLLFVCAHPAIDANMRTPLMLQTVLGLDAARIGSAFLVAPATMGQRLVRAEKKIAAAAISFETPGPEELPARLTSVLDAVYAAFGAGYDNGDGADERRAGLSEEAIYLAGLITAQAPNVAEAHGLLALMLYIHARRSARRAKGLYIPFDDQDTRLWEKKLIAAAETSLGEAARRRAPGRYQIEAAIQSAHMTGRMRHRDNAMTIVQLYDRLLSLAPSTGARVGHAAALIRAGRPAEALGALDAVNRAHAERYQPYWATRAHALSELDQHADAICAYSTAIGLCEDQAMRVFLEARKAKLSAISS